MTALLKCDKFIRIPFFSCLYGMLLKNNLVHSAALFAEQDLIIVCGTKMLSKHNEFRYIL